VAEAEQAVPLLAPRPAKPLSQAASAKPQATEPIAQSEGSSRTLALIMSVLFAVVIFLVLIVFVVPRVRKLLFPQPSGAFTFEQSTEKRTRASHRKYQDVAALAVVAAMIFAPGIILFAASPPTGDGAKDVVTILGMGLMLIVQNCAIYAIVKRFGRLPRHSLAMNLFDITVVVIAANLLALAAGILPAFLNPVLAFLISGGVWCLVMQARYRLTFPQAVAIYFCGALAAPGIVAALCFGLLL